MSVFQKRIVTDAEALYLFQPSTQIAAQTGLIGCLRVSIDFDGTGFSSIWSDIRKDLKVPEFSQEFDKLINSLRGNGDIFSGRKALSRYCTDTLGHRIAQGRSEYGIRVDTEKYAYLMRLDPDAPDYNAHIYCYFKQWLDSHLQNSERGIRFIDSHYHELFRIPDGGQIRVSGGGRETYVRDCRYIDDYHVEIGNSLYHICEFAERLEYTGQKCEPVR